MGSTLAVPTGKPYLSCSLLFTRPNGTSPGATLSKFVLLNKSGVNSCLPCWLIGRFLSYPSLGPRMLGHSSYRPRGCHLCRVHRRNSPQLFLFAQWRINLWVWALPLPTYVSEVSERTSKFEVRTFPSFDGRTRNYITEPKCCNILGHHPIFVTPMPAFSRCLTQS